MQAQFQPLTRAVTNPELNATLMSPPWGVFLLIVLGAIWVIVEEVQKAGREQS